MHRWAPAKNPDGEFYGRCVRCGKDCTAYPGNVKGGPNDTAGMRFGWAAGPGGPGPGGMGGGIAGDGGGAG
jgi:hypothetical protein